MKVSQKNLMVVIGSAFAASVATTAVHAAENPFALKPLASGYMVAEAEKAKEGKCSTGKCGANKAKMEEKAKEASCKADKASTSEKAKEGSCSADKNKEASCKADKK